MLAPAVLIVASATSRAHAWGPVGHETVAYLAEDNLTAKARKKIAALLGPDVDLASVSNWADMVRINSRPETAPWHFIDIEDRIPETEADEPKFCPNHDCVVDQIEIAVAQLKDPATKKPDRIAA
jgi:hypothetical protein